MNKDDSFNLQYRGPIVMKGKPEPMNVWFLTRSDRGKTLTNLDDIINQT